MKQRVIHHEIADEEIALHGRIENLGDTILLQFREEHSDAVLYLENM